MILFFDIGNTNIKLNCTIDGQENYFNFSTKMSFTLDTFWGQLSDDLKNIKVKQVLICSVVPQKTELIVGVSKRYWGIDPIILKYPIKTGIQINTDEPKVVGSDLITLAASAASRSENSLVINLGTATTIIHVKNKVFLGAIICPGLITAYDSLISSASQIGDIPLSLSSGLIIGKNTKDALSIGVLLGHTKMIEGLVENFEVNNIYISGGHAKRILPFIQKFKYEFIREMTIDGMKKIAELNKFS